MGSLHRSVANSGSAECHSFSPLHPAVVWGIDCSLPFFLFLPDRRLSERKVTPLHGALGHALPACWIQDTVSQQNTHRWLRRTALSKRTPVRTQQDISLFFLPLSFGLKQILIH